MSGRFLLDTNIIIGILQGDTAIQKHLHSASEVFVPSIALGELCYGALKSEQHNENAEIIKEFSSGFTVLSCDSKTALFYGEIKKELKSKGKPIPENDIWIAALAKQHSLKLVSRDKHFINIANLKTESWTI